MRCRDLMKVRTSNSVARRRFAALACGAALALVTACGGGGTGPDAKEEPSRVDRETPSSSTVPVTTPTANAPVPRGKGSELPDDINGDGYPDLQLPLPVGPDGGQSQSKVAFVHGSANGLDPATRTVLGRDALGFPAAERDTAPSIAEVTTADLDGDGYADLTTTVAKTRDESYAKRTRFATQRLPYVAWGGPDGPRRGTPATRIHLTGPDDGLYADPVAGDFNGDGHHDLAAVRNDYRSFFVLYGPFTRGGEPARTEVYESPLDSGGEMSGLVADAIEGNRPTDLVVRRMSDGEQSDSVLLTAGSHGLSRTGRALRKGNAVVFGDFDGDGERDVVVADSGSRNNEPGNETEAPDVSESLTIYTAKASEDESPDPIKIGKITGRLAAADTNGDGTDELVLPLGTGGTESLTFRQGSLSEIVHRSFLGRTVPARVDGEKVPKGERAARLYGAADFDRDKKDEIVLGWGRGIGFRLYAEQPMHFWVTDGRDDKVAFASHPFAQAAD
jgi:hypothetical protein